jgi:hypothetical protein
MLQSFSLWGSIFRGPEARRENGFPWLLSFYLLTKMPPKPNPKPAGNPKPTGNLKRKRDTSETIAEDGSSGVRRTRRKVGLAEYDNIIIGYAKDRYRPAEIADRLQDEHGLSPAIANRAAVERRI